MAEHLIAFFCFWVILDAFSFEHWENLCKFNGNVRKQSKDIQVWTSSGFVTRCHKRSQVLCKLYHPDKALGCPCCTSRCWQ
jgi:hypothetical protein